MSHYGLLKDYKFSNASEDIRGALRGGVDHNRILNFMPRKDLLNWAAAVRDRG